MVDFPVGSAACGEATSYLSTAGSMPAGKTGIMVLGTSSDSGKSTIATGLCRMLSDAGLKVAPFKAQNMSLESYVTANGGEISRAQAVQAMACRCEPMVTMNPVLLKPVDGSSSQVIVLGKPAGIMTYRAYQRRSEQMMEMVRESLELLWDEFDVIVCEGAGSPAEINLLDHDIVNLPLARAYSMPAVLVADIERGGVFASVYGTWGVLPPVLSELIRGYVVNKMRGEHDVLYEGVEAIRQMTGMPCIGILPFIDGIGSDAEDSLSRSAAPICPERLETEDGPSGVDVVSNSMPYRSYDGIQRWGSGGGNARSGSGCGCWSDAGGGACSDGGGNAGGGSGSGVYRLPTGAKSAVLDIAVIEFPHLANATDIDPFRLEPAVTVRFVRYPSQLGAPDVVILPGSRSTVADLLWMRSSGLADALCNAIVGEDAFTILGICAGYQIMGSYVDDMVESRCGRVDALGILPVATVMAEDKIVRRRTGVWHSGFDHGGKLENVPTVSGYEIHHGRLSYTGHAGNAGGSGTAGDGCSTGSVVSGDGGPWFLLDDPWGTEHEGFVDGHGRLWGTSVHGLMEDGLTRSLFLTTCARNRSKVWMPSMVSYSAYRESRIDTIAKSVRDHVDLTLLHKIIGIEWE
ncbi:MAG: cobyric acid synthase [Actinobacteria bacterium]|nr:cobyric acid synthase [Actinomycetota bacterium]MCL5446193.1 cobyric acid synthase [Actinomycetota bacterium]